MNSRLLTFLALPVLATACSQVKELPPSEKRIVFFGDSITELGDKPGGYVSLVRDSLKSAPKLGPLGILAAGISGNRVPDLLERVNRDVLALHPNLVVVYIGINDVWHYTLLSGKGTPKDEYENGLREIITQITDSGAGVILCTPSVIGEHYDGSNPLDSMLEEYSEISRTVANSMHVQLCDLRKSFIEYLKENNPQNKDRGILTNDSVHLNDPGNRFVADQMLRAFGEAGIIDPE